MLSEHDTAEQTRVQQAASGSRYGQCASLRATSMSTTMSNHHEALYQQDQEELTK